MHLAILLARTPSRLPALIFLAPVVRSTDSVAMFLLRPAMVFLAASCLSCAGAADAKPSHIMNQRDIPSINSLSTEADRQLREHILPFWLKHARDPKHGGFIGELAVDGTVNDSAPRGPLLAARILWTFSSAYQEYRDPAYREMADYAYKTLMERFPDAANGGFFWQISAEGKILDDRKQIYGHSFILYGLAAYHLATGSPEALQHAIQTYRLIEERSRDREHGGYWEAFTRDWKRPAGVHLSGIGPEEPKSQNTHLHLMEAYTVLYQAWPDPGLREDLRSLVELMLTRISSADGRHLGLYFARDWSPRSTRFSYGHDIEASWLLARAADVLGDPLLSSRVSKAALVLAEATLAEGMDPDGGIMNEGTQAGPDDTDKEWWQQAEAVVGFLNAYQLSGDERHLRASQRVWSFIQKFIVDEKGGEWHRAVDRSGKLKQGHPKLGFWKCPYHNGRACLELVQRVRALHSGSANSGAGAQPPKE